MITRSRKSAVAAAAEKGFREDQVTIVKLATAKYELTFPEPRPAHEILADIEKPTVFDVLGAALLADAQHKEKAAEQAKPTKAPRPTKVNRHFNSDDSVTLYVGGVKIRRIGGEDNEEASDAELEDPEAFTETYLNRKYLRKNGGWVWGRTTHGHNWKNKKAKTEEAAS